MIAGVVLAAGEGRRYGGLKQLHPVDGRPMLERVLERMAAGAPGRRVVVLGSRAGTIIERIDLHGAEPVVCDRWDDGQAASLHAALAALPSDADWALVVLGDGPNLDVRAIRRMAAAAEDGNGEILVADYGEGRSHPVVIPRSRWAEIPDRGERPVRGMDARIVDCRGLEPPGDVDYA